MSFLSRLFGSKSPAPEAAAPAEAKTTAEVEHKGFVIRAVPYKSNGQFQTAGIIEKEVGGTLKSHRFVRADRSTAIEEVTDLAIAKGKLMVDEQGEALFG